VRVPRLSSKPARRMGALVFGALCGASCKEVPLASRAQCELLRDRYLDLELSSAPEARALTPEGRALLRGRLAIEALSGPQAQIFDVRCELHVTETAYKCGVAASTLGAWRRCLE
jgi:hypothetical protein